MMQSANRALIESLASGYDTDHPAVVSSANALNIISSQIYAKEDRFLYELLQNACDSALDIHDGLIVEVSLTEGATLRFSHNGRPFDADDVKSLCMIGDSTKTGDERQIGYKGIGFKSVFTHADRVVVQSGGYGFAFDREHWHHEKRPWQIMPIWCDPVEPEQLTVIELRLHDSSKVRTYLDALADHPELVLFLNNLAQLRISTGDDSVEIECQDREGIVTLLQNSTPHGAYLVRHFVRDVPDAMREGLEGDPNIPDKIKHMSAVPVTFALPLGEDGTPCEDVQPVYSYYPTDDNIGLPVSVNSCFLTNASRERILEDKPWNLHLIKVVANCVGAWLAELALIPEWRARMLYILPSTQSSRGRLAVMMREALETVLPALDCIPTCSNATSIPIPSTVYDKTGLLRLFARSTYTTPEGDSRQRIHDEVQRVDERLGSFEYGLLSLSMSDFPELIAHLKAAVLTPDGNAKLVHHLFAAETGARALEKTAWLLDAEGELRIPEELFWQPAEFDSTEHKSSEIRFVCSELDKAANSSADLKTWLEELGVKTINGITLIQKVLTPILTNSSGALSDEEHDYWWHTALEAHKNKTLGSTEYQTLRSLQVLTKCGQRKPVSECWMGGFYSADSEWERLVGNRPECAFIVESYPRSSKDVQHWEGLFRRCGAKSDIALLDQGRKPRSALPEGYRQWLDNKEIVASIYMPYTHQHSVSNLYTPNVDYPIFADDTIGAQVAARFFGVLAKQGISDFATVTYYVRNNSYQVPSSLVHALATKPIWPAADGRCYRASEVLASLDPSLSDIAAGDIPVLDLGPTTIPDHLLTAVGLNAQPSTTQCLLLLSKASAAETDALQVRHAISLLYSRLAVLRTAALDRPSSPMDLPQDLRLLTHGGSFERPADLFCASKDDDLILFGDHERAFAGDLGPSEAVALLRDLGVKEVTDADIRITPADPQPIPSLVTHLRQRAPLFAALQCGKSVVAGYEATLERTSSLLDKLQAFQVTSYELRDGCHDRSKQFSSGCFFDAVESFLYLTGAWETPSVMHMLAKEMARILGVPDKAHDIHLLLQLSESDGLAWIEDAGYEIASAIPDLLPEPEQPHDEPAPPAPEPDEEEDTLPDPTSTIPPENRRCTSDDYSTDNNAETFGRQLIALLEPQTSGYKGYIYHFTHVENIPAILRDKRIAARAEISSFHDSAGPGLIAHTSESVKRFARFYFRPVTPTQWHNEGLGRSQNGIRAFCPVPIFLRTPLESVLNTAGNRCAVSNGNMASSHSHFGNSPQFLKYFDAENVYALFGTVPLSTYMAASQQEFLVRSALDLSMVPFELVCRDEQDRTTLETVLKANSLFPEDYQIKIAPDCFHADAPRLRVASDADNGFALALVGCRRSVEGSFSLELSDMGTALNAGGEELRVGFDRTISIAGRLCGDMRIHYQEGDERRLVYADQLS